MFNLDEVRKVTRSKGFIHTLSSIVANESIFYSEHQMKSRNRFDLISFNEVALLLSLMSEAPLDLSFPDSREAEQQYQACKSSLDALHREITLSRRAPNWKIASPRANILWNRFFTRQERDSGSTTCHLRRASIN
jgi:hypothetical protein